MMKICKKCGKEFEPQKGLKNYCSLQCRNSRNIASEVKRTKTAKCVNCGFDITVDKRTDLTRCLCNSCKLISQKKYYHKIKQNKIKGPSKRISKYGSENPLWKGGKTKFICRYCGEIGESYELNKKYHGECYKKCVGGYRKGSGRGKKGWYKGYWCDSSYELVWIIYNLEHNIKFERNTKKFDYSYNNKICKYIPDFILEDGTYIEIKGYNTKQVDEKIKQFPYSIKLLMKTDLKLEFDYVINKYGNDFIKLYEGNPHNRKLNKCVICGNSCRNKCCSLNCTGKLLQMK